MELTKDQFVAVVSRIVANPTGAEYRIITVKPDGECAVRDVSRDDALNLDMPWVGEIVHATDQTDVGLSLFDMNGTYVHAWYNSVHAWYNSTLKYAEPLNQVVSYMANFGLEDFLRREIHGSAVIVQGFTLEDYRGMFGSKFKLHPMNLCR